MQDRLISTFLGKVYYISTLSNGSILVYKTDHNVVTSGLDVFMLIHIARKYCGLNPSHFLKKKREVWKQGPLLSSLCCRSAEVGMDVQFMLQVSISVGKIFQGLQKRGILVKRA